MPSYKYSLGPLEWVAADSSGYWKTPAGSVGMLDLRGLPACGEAGTAVHRQVAFVWWPSDAAIPSSHAVLNATAGDCREINATAGMRSAFNSKTGYQPAATLPKLVDLLADLLTNGSVPDASDTVPTLESETIYLPGHSPVWTAPANWRSLAGFSKWANHRLSCKQLHVKQWLDAEQAGRLPPGHAMKAIGGLMVTEGVTTKAAMAKGQTVREDQWQAYVRPQDRAAVRALGGPRIPSTTVSDDFNRADGSLGSNWSADAAWAIVSNQAFVGNGTLQNARYLSALSSSDMSASWTFVSRTGPSDAFAGPSARSSSSQKTCYVAAYTSSGRYLGKCVSGTWTILNQAGVAVPPGVPAANHVIQCDVVGSTIRGIQNGTQVASVTDSAISGHLYAGLFKWTYNLGNVTGDNWSATDGIPDPPPAPTVTPLVTTNTTPTLTGTFTASETNGLELSVGGQDYADDDFGKDGNNWSLEITTPLAVGTYDVVVTASNEGGATSDTTEDELTIEEPEPPSGGEHVNIPFPVSLATRRIHHIHHYYSSRRNHR